LYNIIDSIPEFGIGNLYFKAWVEEKKILHLRIYGPSIPISKKREREF